MIARRAHSQPQFTSPRAQADLFSQVYERRWPSRLGKQVHSAPYPCIDRRAPPAGVGAVRATEDFVDPDELSATPEAVHGRGCPLTYGRSSWVGPESCTTTAGSLRAALNLRLDGGRGEAAVSVVIRMENLTESNNRARITSLLQRRNGGNEACHHLEDVRGWYLFDV